MSLPRAFLFPGQGAQTPGMAVDLAAKCPEARRLFERAKEMLGWDVLGIARDGPASELNSTRVSQPAIFLHSMAVLEILGRLWGAGGPFCRGVPALATAGLSLGEYSALVFAGSLEFEDALRIVALRGECMQRACEASRGTMAAVLGFPAEKVESIVAALRAEGTRVGVANYNSPDQTVISGQIPAVDIAAQRLQAAGAKRVMRLNVAGAFHSEQMSPAAMELEPHLRKAAIRQPRIPFYANVTGTEVSDPEAIREGLIRQVESSVRWKHTVLGLVGRGMMGAYEVGPGKVIQGLVRAVRKDIEVLPVGTCADLEALKDSRPQVQVPAERT